MALEQSLLAPSPLAAASDGERSAALIQRYAAGDQGAFDDLVREHQQAAYLAAWRIVGDGEAAHDTTQEAFLRVMRHHSQYDPARPFRAWLLSIVRNLAIDTLRRRRRFAHPDQLRDLGSAPVAPALEGVELRERVALVLADVPEKYRDILVMREMEGMPAEDIATQIGVDYGTTRWRLHQARRLFREAWIARFGEEL
jgi:RNA polymerase sigma factor (sigma-70 family)